MKEFTRSNGSTFGPTNSSGIFHHEIQKAFAGLPGCITIHDNLLVHNRDEEHNKNLERMLQRAKDVGITLKRSQITICSPEVNWFGRVFSPAGISADPGKIDRICNAGRPESIQDVKSLLQAAAYNAKFAFDYSGKESYEEVTAPLRELLNKDAKFEWNERRDASFPKLLDMMNDETVLVPFNLENKTHLVTDASPFGISASLYQEDDAGRWIPVDHVSRALSDHEMAWQSQIDWESLAKMWGMVMFRPYLIGTKFTSWGDQQPLVSLYNDMSRPASVRINKHRHKAMDLSFTDKYLPGRANPADYNSRHPKPIKALRPQERENLMVDDGDDIQVMRVMLADLPPAVTMAKLEEAVRNDPVYLKLMEPVRGGQKQDRSDPDLIPYASVWQELAIVQGLVC